MDMADLSAMTEASGLENDPAPNDTSSTARGAPRSGGPRPEPQSAAADLSDELRRITAAAPLRSLLAAFLLGMLVARRRRG
ncbi:hypothetical protein [Bradyrhizobium sp. Gha]|uniref:hypothetical protein n=1 Tax=Bradyrhizobium sp. Gha TaxID=1855318 RepID=UPI0008E47E94|nr:hypothetical protein [Bradyrhizobium sp. Gha]SFH69100.1 hypothetical protein SAMN05216525_101320 [Bradyrhizobium sp. Gha]